MSLTIAVLSYSDEFYTTQRLVDVGRGLGHNVTLLNPFGLTIETRPDGMRLYDDKTLIKRPDVIIPRVGAVLTDWNLLVVDALIRAGSRSTATSHSLGLAADKAKTAIALANAGIPTIQTSILREEASISSVLNRVRNEKIVLKLPHGTQGRHVVGVNCHLEARKQIVEWLKLGHPVLVQPWIPMERPRDLRVMVIAQRAVGAIWRYAKAGDFRSNIHQGGHAERAELSPEARELAKRAVQAIGLNCGAVDLLETSTGLAVMEINGCPGFRSIEDTTDLDIASLWIQAAIDG